jgi:hypothetical protein
VKDESASYQHRAGGALLRCLRVVESGGDAVTDSHLTDALLRGSNLSLDKIDSPAQKGIPCSRPALHPRHNGGSGLSSRSQLSAKSIAAPTCNLEVGKPVHRRPPASGATRSPSIGQENDLVSI